MRLAELDHREVRELAVWINRARAHHPARVELHVFAQGYELRCGELPPFRMMAVPELVERTTERPPLTERRGYDTRPGSADQTTGGA